MTCTCSCAALRRRERCSARRTRTVVASLRQSPARRTFVVPSEVESLESFRERARAFIRANLRPASQKAAASLTRADRGDEEELAEVAREREIQRLLFDAGLA